MADCLAFIQDLSQSFRRGEVLEDAQPRCRRGRVHRAARPLRLRQVHPAQLHRRPARHHRRADLRSTGKNVTWEEPKDRGIGMVFQSYALYPHNDGARGTCPSACASPAAEAGDRQARRAGRRDSCRSSRCSTASRAAFRRPAPARRDRPRAGARRRRLPVRRAAVQPRRQAAHRAARRDQAAAPRAGSTP